MNCELTETPLGNGQSTYTCLRCGRTDKLPSGYAKAKRTCQKPGPPGPGACLAQLLKEIGIEPTGDCKCFKRAAAMDANGIEWCVANKPIIVGWLREATSESSWASVFSAAGGLWGKPWFSVMRPLESIVDESLRRANTPSTPPPESR
jgi:hypothetical protein